MTSKVYIMEHLGCANCAAKIEHKIASLPGVHEVSITFATKQLRLTADDPDTLLPEIQKIANSLEPEIVIIERKRRSSSVKAEDAQREHHHEHHHHAHHEHDEEECSCGCGHEHHKNHKHHLDEDECSCGCGHEHHENHNHEHGEDDCSCGCGHEHHEHNEHHNHHHGENDCSCGCGHEHHEHHDHSEHLNHMHDEDDCSCGCGREHLEHNEPHNHHHSEDDCSCGCGHEHHELHEHLNHVHDEDDCSCGCGHEHHDHNEHHNHHHEHHHKHVSGDVTKTYIVEHLGCANCAAKMERQINKLPGVTSATLTFATKQLRVTGADPDSLLSEMQAICASVESEVILKPKDAPPQSKSAPSKDLISICSGTALFLFGIILEQLGFEVASILALVIGYLILGGEILLTAAKNMLKGHVFDENFLMSIATLGAFAIQEYPEAVGVMLFYRIGEYFEHRAVEKSRSQIMDAIDMRPEVVNLVHGEEIRVIDAHEANVGDLLLVRPGDRIPLDGVIVEGESRIDTSPVTGEPVPVKAVPGDTVISGCINTSGVLKMRAEKILEESMVTRILDSVENAAASKPKIDRFITRFARIYTPFVVLLALATAVIPSLVTGDWNYWVYTALSFLVISCPCALVLSVPLAFFAGIGSGSKVGILFKGGVALEAIKNIKTIIMDKTGTITKGNFVVQEAVPASDAVTPDELLAWCAACESSSTHPIGNSIVTAAKEKNLSLARPLQIEEIAGHGIKAVLEQGTFLCGNKKLMEKFGVHLHNYHKAAYGTEVLAAKNGVFIGHLVISDTVKDDAKEAVSRMKQLGITPVMLTGDSQESAQAVADFVGIKEVHARLLPEDKVNELNEIRNAHGAVMFVGDGINDAPVLAGADVGAAMGSGADAAIEAADVVFMTSNMAAIPQAVDIARLATKISWQNVTFALAVKFFVMILGLAGFASMWMAVFADTGVAMLCVLNSVRILYKK